MRWLLLSCFLGIAPVASAGQIVLEMPDESLQQALSQLCYWHHCLYGSDQELLERAKALTIRAMSLNRHPNLKQLGGTITLRYDTERAAIAPAGEEPHELRE